MVTVAGKIEPMQGLWLKRPVDNGIYNCNSTLQNISIPRQNEVGSTAKNGGFEMVSNHSKVNDCYTIQICKVDVLYNPILDETEHPYQ